MIRIDDDLKPADLLPKIDTMWKASAAKIRSIDKSCPPGKASPVFTVKGQYTARGWTEWTQGFQYGSALLQFDATGDEAFLNSGRELTRKAMAPHLTHMGVHDHGFNNVSTYGNLWRLMNEKRIPEVAWEREFYELALKVAGAVQARRWTKIKDGGYIYSFNGPHSLFSDTIRSLRALAVAHLLGHVLSEENDRAIPLLERYVQHAQATAKYNVYYGEGRDAYDLRGRVVHESIFNTNDGAYRCPSSQQGYSPFSTWTRGLAWVLCGAGEALEFLAALGEAAMQPYGGKAAFEATLLKMGRATADFYLEHTPVDGVPYWDTGAPGLARMGDYLSRPAEPDNDHEPVDSSAAAITAQGLLRLGRYLKTDGKRYTQAGLTVMRTLLDAPYLSTDASHQGLLLHSVYHRPNGWDYVPPGAKVPRGESSMWGDYHFREAALYVQRLAKNGTYHTFFGPRP